MTNEYFDAQAAQWDDNPIRVQLSNAVWQFVESCNVFGENVSAMDYGCGTGLMSVRLAEKLKTVYAVDVSIGMIGRLCEKIDENKIANIRVVRHDMTTDEPLKISPEIIVSAMALHHIDNTADIIEKMVSQVAPGGNIILADLCSEDGSFHSDVEVFHNGFEPSYIEGLLKDNDAEIVSSEVVHDLVKNEKAYPIFGICAKKKV